MAKAEVTTREVEITLTLTEQEAYYLYALVGAQDHPTWGGVPETAVLFNTLEEVLPGKNPFKIDERGKVKKV